MRAYKLGEDLLGIVYDESITDKKKKETKEKKNMIIIIDNKCLREKTTHITMLFGRMLHRYCQLYDLNIHLIISYPKITTIKITSIDYQYEMSKIMAFHDRCDKFYANHELDIFQECLNIMTGTEMIVCFSYYAMRVFNDIKDKYTVLKPDVRRNMNEYLMSLNSFTEIFYKNYQVSLNIASQYCREMIVINGSSIPFGIVVGMKYDNQITINNNLVEVNNNCPANVTLLIIGCVIGCLKEITMLQKRQIKKELGQIKKELTKQETAILSRLYYELSNIPIKITTTENEVVQICNEMAQDHNTKISKAIKKRIEHNIPQKIISHEPIIDKTEPEFEKSNELFTSLYTLSSWYEELENNSVMCILMNLSINQKTKIGIWENGTIPVKVKSMSKVCIPIGDYLARVKTYFANEHIKYDISGHSIFSGTAIGSNNAIFPLYIHKNHWNLTKQYLHNILGLTFCGHPFGFHPIYYDYMFQILAEIGISIVENNMSDDITLTYFFNIIRVCFEIAKKLHYMRDGLINYIANYNHSKSIYVIYGQLLATGTFMTDTDYLKLGNRTSFDEKFMEFSKLFDAYRFVVYHIGSFSKFIKQIDQCYGVVSCEILKIMKYHLNLQYICS